MVSLNFIYKGLVSVVVDGDQHTIGGEIEAALRAAEKAAERAVPGYEPEHTTPPTTTH